MGLILASQSPRRRELMRLVAENFAVDDAGVQEDGVHAATPCLLAETLARAKAEAVFARRSADVVLGCDTVVEVQGATLGKPQDAEEAVRMLALLANRWHQVHTGLCLCAPGQAPVVFCESTRVQMAAVPAEEILAYAATEEPYDKAGGYGVQGWAARYITRLEGCYYNVMGLPVARLYHELHSRGYV